MQPSGNGFGICQAGRYYYIIDMNRFVKHEQNFLCVGMSQSYKVEGSQNSVESQYRQQYKPTLFNYNE